MTPIARHRSILEKLEEFGEVSVVGLAENMNVTTETIRRDLALLEKAQKLIKIHGGAISSQKVNEGSFEQRLSCKREQKEIIALYAAKLIKENDVVFIDSCTTNYSLSTNLTIGNITVITNSPRIADGAKKANDSNNIILLGGLYNSYYQATLGGETVSQIAQYQSDISFIGAGGINSEENIMIKNHDEGVIAKEMLSRSQKRIVLCDSSKFYQSGLFKVSGVSEVDTVITNSSEKDEYLRQSFSDNIIFV